MASDGGSGGAFLGTSGGRDDGLGLGRRRLSATESRRAAADVLFAGTLGTFGVIGMTTGTAGTAVLLLPLVELAVQVACFGTCGGAFSRIGTLGSCGAAIGGCLISNGGAFGATLP